MITWRNCSEKYVCASPSENNQKEERKTHQEERVRDDTLQNIAKSQIPFFPTVTFLPQFYNTVPQYHNTIFIIINQ